jgi:hypothetical protein
MLSKDISEPIIDSSKSKKRGDAQMKGKIFGLLAAGLLAGPIIASATPSYAPVDFLGTIDVTCVGYSAGDCGTGGAIPVSGSLSSNGTIDFGVSGNPTLFAGSLSGSNAFTGVATSLDGDVYDWTFNHTGAPATSSIVGDWSGTGTVVVIGGSNGAPELADLVIASTANSAPEIDSTSAASSIALLLGGLAVLSGRKRQRVAA